MTTTSQPQLVLLCGANGAGKSTFYEHFLKPRGVAFINADVLAKSIFLDAPEVHNSYAAAQLAERLRHERLERGTSFCFETVLSHFSKVDFLAAAKARGYEIQMVFVHLSLPELNVARVHYRARLGGHAVPEDKILSRLPRVLQHVRQTIPLCDGVHALDNSDAVMPFKRVFALNYSHLQIDQDPLPSWAAQMLNQLASFSS